MYYTGRLEVFNENFPAVSNLISMVFLTKFLFLFLKFHGVMMQVSCLLSHLSGVFGSGLDHPLDS